MFLCIAALYPVLLSSVPWLQGFQVAEVFDLFPCVLPTLNLYSKSFRFFSLANCSFSHHILRLGLDFSTLKKSSKWVIVLQNKELFLGVLKTRDSVVIRPLVQFLRVVLRAEDVDWHFKRQEWAEESLRIETIVTEKSMCTGRETPCAVRTVGQKTNSRLKLKCAIGLFFHAFL